MNRRKQSDGVLPGSGSRAHIRPAGCRGAPAYLGCGAGVTRCHHLVHFRIQEEQPSALPGAMINPSMPDDRPTFHGPLRRLQAWRPTDPLRTCGRCGSGADHTGDK